jgi:hypothetical protein
MQDTVAVDVNAPLDKVVRLFADPRITPAWMHDVERYEPLSGEQGMSGSTYRLIPKKGSLVFTATVVERKLPHKLRLRLDASNVTVDVLATLSTLAGDRTRLVSEETFSFKGLAKIFSLFARPAIHKAHRQHMEAFKQFAERSP